MSARRPPSKQKPGKPVAAEEKKEISQTEEALQLRKDAREMKEKVAHEMAQAEQFSHEKETVLQFWNIEKRKCEERKLELRTKAQQKDALKEKQEFDLKLHKQKVMYLLQEQQAAATDKHIDGENALKLAQDNERKSEMEQQKEQQEVKMLNRETELRHIDLIRDLKQVQENKIMEMRQEFERQSDEMKNLYEKRMKEVRVEVTARRTSEVQSIKNKKAAFIKKLMLKHMEEFKAIKQYYNDITFNNFDKIRILKAEVIDKRNQELIDEKEMASVTADNKKLADPLKQYIGDYETLRQNLAQYDKDKMALKESKEKLVVLMEGLTKLQWEHEITEQKFEKLSQERDLLRDKLDDAIYEVQQKAGFKNLLLEKKLEAMQDEIEKKEIALHELLVQTQLEPDVLGQMPRSLEAVLSDKDKQIASYEQQLSDMKQSYRNMLQAYEAKLQKYSIPVSELGFTPRQF